MVIYIGDNEEIIIRELHDEPVNTDLRIGVYNKDKLLKIFQVGEIEKAVKYGEECYKDILNKVD